MKFKKQYWIKCCAWNKGVLVYNHKRYDKGNYAPIINMYTNEKPKTKKEALDMMHPKYLNQVEMYREVEVYENTKTINSWGHTIWYKLGEVKD